MNEQGGKPDWFLAQLKPNGAALAARNLKRQGFRTFLPTECRTFRSGSTFKTLQAPLFPGYIFVALDATSSPWRSINSTVGVGRLVSFGTGPAQVPHPIIDALLRRCDADGVILPEPVLQPGDPVRLISGPFEGFVAEIERLETAQRVWVLFEFMGSKKRLGVGTDQLRAV